jgi:hypothetical protein
MLSKGDHMTKMSILDSIKTIKSKENLGNGQQSNPQKPLFGAGLPQYIIPIYCFNND